MPLRPHVKRLKEDSGIREYQAGVVPLKSMPAKPKLALLALLPFIALPAATAETLKEQLDAKRAAFLEKAPPEKAASYQEGIDTVAGSGIYDAALKVGDKAPDFTLPDPTGKEVKLSDLLESGPVVLTWYRGGWCPYCNIALLALQKKLPEFKEAGAQLVAITPETPDHSLDTTEKQNLDFEVLSDVGNKVAEEYGIVFKMTPEVAAAMEKGFGLSKWNDDDSGELPLAASYVVAPDGTITYAFLDADYRNRAEPARLIDAVQAIGDEPSPTHLVQQFWENVWNPPYDLELVDKLVAEDFVLTSAGKDVEGRAEFKKWIEGVQAKVADIRLENLDTFPSEDGSKVTSRWKATGKNQGLFDSDPDGRPVEFTGIAIWEVEDGKLTHNWVERATWEMYQESFSEDKQKDDTF